MLVGNFVIRIQQLLHSLALMGKAVFALLEEVPPKTLKNGAQKEVNKKQATNLLSKNPW